MKKALLLGAALVGLLSAPLIAQTITQRSISGTSTIEASVGGPGGTLQDATVAQMRDAQGVSTTSLTTGTLVTTTSTATLVSTAASASLTVDLPAKPYDGEIFEWVNGSGSAFTAGTIAQTDGSTIHGSTAAGTLADGGSVEFRYVLSTNTWYKMR